MPSGEREAVGKCNMARSDTIRRADSISGCSSGVLDFQDRSRAEEAEDRKIKEQMIGKG